MLAAADGAVVAIDDTRFDRNTSCEGEWNFVSVLHANGFKAYFGHLTQGSVDLRPSDALAAGDIIGVVGSSGCSTQPHLHFELRNCDDQVVDPFQLNLWDQPPEYVTALGILDFVVKDGAINDESEIKDPASNASQFSPLSVIGLGVSAGGGVSGDRLALILVDPNDSESARASIRFRA